MKESSSRGLIKGLRRIFAKTHIKMLKYQSRTVMMRSLKWFHDVAKDSSSSCLKFRTSFWRLTTLEMGKKRKQNLEHNVSQSPCILPMVRLYHVLALSIKENRNNFHLKVLSDKPVIRKHAQVCANSHMCDFGFSLPTPRRIVPKSVLLNTGAAHSQVLR
jgi:hypothetical protein